jgi:NitT/TauT family transport system permease protein
MKQLPFLALCLFLIFLWETLSFFQILPTSLFPPPHDVLSALKETPSEWKEAFYQTSLASGVGLFLSLALGIFSALLLSLSSVLKRAFLPLAVFFQTVPIIAIAPLLVIYFGFGLPTVIAASAIVSFFPVLASFLLGLENIEKEKLELFKLYRASRFQTLVKLRAPAAFLSLYSGLKIAVGLSIIGTVAGEFVAGGGLGAIIDSARTQQRVDRVYAALLLLSGLGILALAFLKLIFKSLHKIRPYGAESEEFK